MTDYERIVNISDYRPKLLAQQPTTQRVVWVINTLLAIMFAVGVAAVSALGWGLICAVFSIR